MNKKNIDSNKVITESISDNGYFLYKNFFEIKFIDQVKGDIEKVFGIACKNNFKNF